MKSYFNKTTIAKLYCYIRNYTFESLSDEKIKELDDFVDYWRYYFTNDYAGLLSTMTFTAEKMIVSNGRYGVKTWEEKAYFYIKIIDPDFLFLEAHETGNTMQEIKDLCKLNFGIYDPYLIELEKRLYKRLQIKEDLWSRERILRK